ncbi:MAG: BCCT family transporter, partial [Planctomycetota bacterium]
FGLAIVVTFVVSSVSGLMNGLRILSDWNTKIFFAIAAFVFVTGPTLFIMQQGGTAFVDYFATVVPRTLAYGASNDTAWVHQWTIFYWAVWMAWAPVTALFLGRISYGYTVREFVLFNFALPSLFGAVWMSIFGGTAIYFQLHTQANLYQLVQDQGIEQAVYGMFEQLPLANLLSVVFLGISFLSFVTAADSNTTAMGGISSSGISPESPEAPMPIKIAWGVIIGLTAWIMVSFNGIEGIRMTSNLGGFPALFLLFFVTVSLVVMMFQADRYRGPEVSDSKGG